MHTFLLCRLNLLSMQLKYQRREVVKLLHEALSSICLDYIVTMQY